VARFKASTVALPQSAFLWPLHFFDELHHRFRSIHPFLDANGRAARRLIDQAARELLNLGITEELTANQAKYFDVLMQADRGDLAPLTRTMLASLG
jgi:Fic family protein